MAVALTNFKIFDFEVLNTNDKLERIDFKVSEIFLNNNNNNTGELEEEIKRLIYQIGEMEEKINRVYHLILEKMEV